MYGWRNKVLVILVVYFAGFATAIYTIAPSGITASETAYVSDEKSDQSMQAQEIVMKIKYGMKKFLSVVEEIFEKVGTAIRKKLQDSQ